MWWTSRSPAFHVLTDVAELARPPCVIATTWSTSSAGVGGLPGDADGPTARRGRAGHRHVAAEADEHAAAECPRDLGGGAVGRQRLGRRPQVEPDAPRDADGAIGGVELHVGVPRHRAERRRRCGRTGPDLVEVGVVARGRRWRCRSWGRRRRRCARPHRPRRAALRTAARRPPRVRARPARAPPAARSPRGTGYRPGRAHPARRPGCVRPRRRPARPARRPSPSCRWHGRSARSARARPKRWRRSRDVPPEVTVGVAVLELGAVETLPVFPVRTGVARVEPAPVVPRDVERHDPPVVVSNRRSPDPLRRVPSERPAAPGWSWATTTPMPTVAPAAARTRDPGHGAQAALELLSARGRARLTSGCDIG